MLINTSEGACAHRGSRVRGIGIPININYYYYYYYEYYYYYYEYYYYYQYSIVYQFFSKCEYYTRARSRNSCLTE